MYRLTVNRTRQYAEKTINIEVKDMTNAIIAFLPSLGMPEIIIILVAMLLLFGGKKLPELARGLGKGLRQFKEEVHAVKSDVDDAMNEEPDYTETASKDSSDDSDDSADADEDKGPDADSKA